MPRTVRQRCERIPTATPNGETILINNGTMTANAALGVEQRFDLQKDLTPIMAIGKTPVAAKTPQSIVDQLRTALMALAQEEATRTWLSDRLIAPMAMDGPELQALIATELESWKARANRYNIVAD